MGLIHLKILKNLEMKLKNFNNFVNDKKKYIIKNKLNYLFYLTENSDSGEVCGFLSFIHKKTCFFLT